MRKVLAFLVSMIFVLVCAGANADVIYLTDSGELGRISVAKSISADLRGTQYTVSWSDPFLGSYWDGSNTRVILVDRNTDTTTSGDTALVFNPSDLTSPIDSTRKVLDGLYSAQVMTGSDNGRAIFFASGASIYEFSTSNFSLSRSYTYKPKTSEDMTAEIAGLITGTNVIYALVQQTNSRDVLLRFDGQLREDVSGSFEKVLLAENTTAISWLNDTRIAISHKDGVHVRGSSNVFAWIVSSDVPAKAVCRDSGSGFYFIEQSESEDICTTTLKHYNSSTEEISTLFVNTEGHVCQLVRDGDNGIMAAIVGDEILVYKMEKDELLGEYDSSQLGSNPVQIAASAVSGDDGSTKSGCSLSGMGAVMIFLAGMRVIRKRRGNSQNEKCVL